MFIRLVSVFTLLFSLVFVSRYAIHSDLIFHTDIARDFLLIEDIYKTRKLSLIGSRAGGIPGFFHGPLWLYTNLPAFIAGHGNPAVVAWFWVALFLVLLLSTFFITKKLSDTVDALLTSALVAVVVSPMINNLTNPFGALLCMPAFFYFLYKYIRTYRPLNLAVAFFLIGLIIQYQIALGLPLLLLSTILSIHLTHKKRKAVHLLATLVILIPLSTYAIFEVRHNFLQVRSFFGYLFGNVSYGKQNFLTGFLSRMLGMWVDGIGMWPPQLRLLNLVVALWFVYLIRTRKKLSKEFRQIFYLFLYLYVGFWVCSFFFAGVIWSYYYGAFLPLVAIILVLSGYYLKKNQAVRILVFLILLSHIFFMAQGLMYSSNGWKAFHKIAADIYRKAPSKFGYYIYTPDQFGYSMRYAMNYSQRSSNSIGFLNVKQSSTFLIVAPSVSGKKDKNVQWWKLHQVKIMKEPINSVIYPNGYSVQEYRLTPEEVAIADDPNLVSGSLLFR